MTDKETSTSTGASSWQGRFPSNEIISLLDVNRTLNLAESTSQDLTLAEVLALPGLEHIQDLRLGYGSSAGAGPLREAISRVSNVPAEHVLTTQGTALGLFLLALQVCRPGDEAVLISPCFPPSRDSLIGAGVKVRDVRLSFDDAYRIDFDELADAITPATKLISLASPQNPSGVQTSITEIRTILHLMEERAPDCWLFVDETYREATYGEERGLESAANLHPRVITGSSVSKALGAPGLRTGWLTVADPLLRERLTIAKMNTVISGSVLDEMLATALIDNRETVLNPRRAMLARALERLTAWCAEQEPNIEWIRPDAGALCCVRLRREVFDDAAVARFWAILPGHELQLASGGWFGESERVFRLGFGYLPADRFAPALDALASAMSAARGR